MSLYSFPLAIDVPFSPTIASGESCHILTSAPARLVSGRRHPSQGNFTPDTAVGEEEAPLADADQ